MHTELQVNPFCINDIPVQAVAELCIYDAIQWKRYLMAQLAGDFVDCGFILSIILN